MRRERSPLNNGLGIRTAPGQPASTAVCSRQGFINSFNLGIHIDIKDFGCQGQTGSDDDAQSSHDDQTTYQVMPPLLFIFSNTPSLHHSITPSLQSSYTMPLKAKKARDIMPAPTRPIDVSWRGFGTLARRIRSRMPANKTNATPNPTA